MLLILYKAFGRNESQIVIERQTGHTVAATISHIFVTGGNGNIGLYHCFCDSISELSRRTTVGA
jgi:hypothetical protein